MFTGKKRGLEVTKTPESFAGKCRNKTCSRHGVIKCKRKEPECLLHYSCGKSSLYPLENQPTVYNKEKLEAQYDSSLKSLWDDAVGDVVMMMYDAQREEQKLMRDNPLAVLQLDSHRINIDLIGCERLMDKTQAKSSSTLISSSKTSIWRHSSQSTEDCDDDISEGLRSHNDQCGNCDSIKTVRRYSAVVYDVQKSETWGAANTPSTKFQVICQDCGTSRMRAE
jgi:hypothetical protein